MSRRAAIVIGSVSFFFLLKKQHDPTHTFTEMRLELEVEVVVMEGGGGVCGG